MSVDQRPQRLTLTPEALQEIERQLGCTVEGLPAPYTGFLQAVQAYVSKAMHGLDKQDILNELQRLTVHGGRLAIYVQHPPEPQLVLDSLVVGHAPGLEHLKTLTFHPTG